MKRRAEVGQKKTAASFGADRGASSTPSVGLAFMAGLSVGLAANEDQPATQASAIHLTTGQDERCVDVYRGATPLHLSLEDDCSHGR